MPYCRSIKRGVLTAASAEGESGEPNWYAVQTMSRHEKQVIKQLEAHRVRTFLPLVRQVRRWSDRRSVVEMPMFGCYAFVRIAQCADERLNILRTPGVVGFVGSERQGTPIPDEQIESIRIAINQETPLFPHPFISTGQRVRVRGGSLDGIEGILVRKGKAQNLVLSIELLHRSTSIQLDGYDIEIV
jgi:transcription antitermination factor NusG